MGFECVVWNACADFWGVLDVLTWFCDGFVEPVTSFQL